MLGKLKKAFLTAASLLISYSLFLISGPALAQTSAGPQFMITWQASGSYVPPGYIGKALPNQGSKISASVALVSNGQLVNLGKRTVYWYLNDTLIGGGIGVQNISFTPFGGAPNFMTLKVEIPNYNGNLLLHAIQIPLVEPKAAIEAQHVNGKFSSNPLALTGTPYYFNTADPSSLTYQWSVNGQSPATAENPQTLQVNLDQGTPSGSSFAVALTIANPADTMTAADTANLTYVKQP